MTPSSPDEINLLTLNCWGLLALSAQRQPRLAEIGRQIAAAHPPPSIVCLQECWVQADYEAIRDATRHLLPHAKFYFCGVIGSGLAILSRWPIVDSDMRSYPLNGRPSAFFRGDWYAGKGIASASIKYGPGEGDVVEVFNTHTHAPYGTAPHSQYTAHRTAQTWLLSKLLRAASQRGHLVVAMGDFNMLPRSFAHRLLTSHSPVRDVWRLLHPQSALGPAKKLAATTQTDGKPVDIPTAGYNLRVNGATSDGPYNTWRWPKEKKARLRGGDECPVDPDTPDPDGKRLDYIFASTRATASRSTWTVASASVAMTQRHPELLCSLSDHFAVQATLRRQPDDASTTTLTSKQNQDQNQDQELPRDLDDHAPTAQLYDDILAIVADFTAGEARQQTWRARHFYLSVLVWVGCLVAVWFSPRNYVAFLLVLLASLGLASGVVDGLIALLFFQSEFRALKEFTWDIENAKSLLAAAAKTAS